MNPGKVIAITSLKGGVGKTTSAVNIAACFAAMGKNTLLLDLDPHTGATMHLGLDFKDLELTAYDLLMEPDIVLRDVVCGTRWKKLSIIPSSGDLIQCDAEMESRVGRENLLYEKFDNHLHQYDFLIIDVPPVVSLLLFNALRAADFVLTPFRTDYMSVVTMDELNRLITKVSSRLNPGIEILGYFGTMYDKRTKESEQSLSDMRGKYGDKVFNTVIPANVALARAARDGVPITECSKHSVGASSYQVLSEEILARITHD